MESIREVENFIQLKREYESKLTEYTDTLRVRSDKNKLKELSEFRNIEMETLEHQGVFFIGEMAEMLIPKFLKDIKSFGVISNTNNKPIFHNRHVFPIKNEEGLVQNLVGYSPTADERYIYGTAKYYRRKDTLFGLENLYLAYEMGYAVLTEGITDAVMLRNLGIPNAFGNCGTHSSTYVMNQLDRCEYGIIKIPDRDSAGIMAKKKWITSRMVTLNPPAKYKDIDEMLREQENREWFMEYFNECVKYIKSNKHMKGTWAHVEVTII